MIIGCILCCFAVLTHALLTSLSSSSLALTWSECRQCSESRLACNLAQRLDPFSHFFP
jgi:hypothetical protein